jgi:hypothetical protein
MAKNLRRPEGGFNFTFSFIQTIQLYEAKYYEMSLYNLINNLGCQDPNFAYFDITISDSDKISQKVFDSKEYNDYNGKYKYDRWNEAKFCFRINSNNYKVKFIF